MADKKPLQIYKFLVTPDNQVTIGTIVHVNCLALAIAESVEEARRLCRDDFYAHHQPYEWLDHPDVYVTSFPLDKPACLGLALL